MGASVQIIEDSSLKVTPEGFEIGLRLNWYRSLPVSSVEELKLSLDGGQIPGEKITFEINGHSFQLQELEDLVEEFWFVQDSAHVRVHLPGKIAAGETHTLAAEIALRYPYIAVGPGKFLVNTSRCTKTMTAHL